MWIKKEIETLTTTHDITSDLSILGHKHMYIYEYNNLIIMWPSHTNSLNCLNIEDNEESSANIGHVFLLAPLI